MPRWRTMIDFDTPFSSMRLVINSSRFRYFCFFHNEYTYSPRDWTYGKKTQFGLYYMV